MSAVDAALSVYVFGSSVMFCITAIRFGLGARLRARTALGVSLSFLYTVFAWPLWLPVVLAFNRWLQDEDA